MKRVSTSRKFKNLKMLFFSVELISFLDMRNVLSRSLFSAYETIFFKWRVTFSKLRNQFFVNSCSCCIKMYMKNIKTFLYWHFELRVPQMLAILVWIWGRTFSTETETSQTKSDSTRLDTYFKKTLLDSTRLKIEMIEGIIFFKQ